MHTIVIILLVLSGNYCWRSSGEWIEIKQNTTPVFDSKRSSIKILKKTFPFTNLSEAQLTPSPQWIEYQRERFSEAKRLHSHKLIVTASHQLKNSAKVIVPAQQHSSVISVDLTKNSPMRNQYFHTKNRLTIIDEKPTAEVVQWNPVETTSRRDMPTNHDYEDADTENNDKDEPAATAEDNIVNEENQLQYPSLEGFIKFLKSMQKTWLKHTSFTLKDKIDYLKRLRDDLMRNIEKQFAILWDPSEGRRYRRGILDESTLNFPPEAAIMSINFLTFAVFLIKLVLRVIHLVKSKHYAFTGLGVSTVPVTKTT